MKIIQLDDIKKYAVSEILDGFNNPYALDDIFKTLGE